MTSACNLHINNLNSVNIIKLRRHLGVQTGLTACTEQSLLGTESVELYVFILTVYFHEHVRSLWQEVPYLWQTYATQSSGSEQKRCSQTSVSPDAEGSKICAFSCMCFVSQCYVLKIRFLFRMKRFWELQTKRVAILNNLRNGRPKNCSLIPESGKGGFLTSPKGPKGFWYPQSFLYKGREVFFYRSEAAVFWRWPLSSFQ
jgi:hypothetical protein